MASRGRSPCAQRPRALRPVAPRNDPLWARHLPRLGFADPARCLLRVPSRHRSSRLAATRVTAYPWHPYPTWRDGPIPLLSEIPPSPSSCNAESVRAVRRFCPGWVGRAADTAWPTRLCRRRHRGPRGRLLPRYVSLHWDGEVPAVARGAVTASLPSRQTPADGTPSRHCRARTSRRALRDGGAHEGERTPTLAAARRGTPGILLREGQQQRVGGGSQASHLAGA